MLTSITTTTNNEDSTTTTVTETIDYDTIGNPISYRGATMGWYGRQMTAYSKDGTKITNTYDAEGIRGSKTSTSMGSSTMKNVEMEGNCTICMTVMEILR